MSTRVLPVGNLLPHTGCILALEPIDLTRFPVRLATPPFGAVFDTVSETKNTGMACLAEALDAILIERDAGYIADIGHRIADIERRIAHVSGGDTPLFVPVAGGSP